MRRLLIATLALGALAPWAGDGRADDKAVNVWTFHNNNARTGLNDLETMLSPRSVDKDHFGKLTSIAVDGAVYAQPLYLSGVKAKGKSRKVVFVATQHDSVYAFDAEDFTEVWHVSFVDGVNVVPLAPADVRCNDVRPEIGITGTPVIRVDPTDVSQSTLYVVSKTKTRQGPEAGIAQHLHALSVVDGSERPGSPVKIAASVPGAGNGSDIPADVAKPGNRDASGRLTFGATAQNQRPGLVLSGGVVYIAWSSHCDRTFYNGWLLGYDATTLAQVAAFNVTPGGGRGGIWQSGAAPAADDAGNLYFSTGNGTFDRALNPAGFPANGDYGDSVVKLARDPSSDPAHPNPNGWGLKVVDYFTPFDEEKLGVPPADLDLGSSGVVLLDNVPGAPPHLLALSGKRGVIYLIDRDAMGHFDPAVDRIHQRIPSDPSALSILGDVFGIAASFGDRLYFVGAPLRTTDGRPIGGADSTPDFLKAFRFAGGRLDVPPASKSTVGFAWKTGTPVVSSNGTGGGVVWIIRAEGFFPASPAVLHAFDAADLSKELYNSEQADLPNGAKRDRAGIGVKFVVPTVADGKVFVPTTNEVTVYGLLGK